MARNSLHSPAISIRKATLSDLDPIVDIALAAMPMDPQWNWRFPYRNTFPEDERQFTRLKFEEFLSSESHWLVMLAEAQYEPGHTIAVSFSIWDMSNLYALFEWSKRSGSTNRGSSPRQSLGVRRDGHPERMQAWSDTTTLAKKILFDHRYGVRYFQLQILATLPEWHGRGAGTALCSWGIELAKIAGMTIAVFASPMGNQLYTKLGFQNVSNVKVQTHMEEDGVILKAMVLD